jgi:MFS family permease
MAKPGEAPATRSPVADFVLLYAVLYGAFGAASPFLPAYVEERGIPAELIGVVFGAGTAIRLIAAPLAGRIADRTHFDLFLRYVPSARRLPRQDIWRRTRSGLCLS